MFQISYHAMQRIQDRKLKAEWLLAALDGKRIIQANGTVLLCDPVSRCAVVIDFKAMLVVTAIRLRPTKYRRLFQRRRN